MRSWAWALGVLAGITALLATTASAELWIPFVSSGSGKTAPVHQPHVARERAERDRDARAKSEHEHKLRGSFGSGVVVTADDPAPPPPPPPPADAEEETTDDYDIEKVETPPRASEDAAPSSSNVEPPRSDDANATKMDDDDRRRSRSETKTAASRSMLYTWGIGGARVGRPSDPSPTPPGRAEGHSGAGAGDGDFDPLTRESAVAAAASGHSALVTDAGALYTAGRNDSAGGGGHGSPPVKDAGQLGRGGRGDAFGRVAMPSDDVKIVSCATGRYHTVALAADGTVLTFGLNDRGQLGRAGTYGVADGDACVCDSGGGCACGGEAEGIEGGAQIEDGGNARTRRYEEGDACVGGAACRDGVARAVDLSEFGAAAVAVAAGRYATAAVLASGEVVTWGLNLCGAGAEGANASDASDGAPPPITRESLLRDPRAAATPRLVRGLGESGGGPKPVVVVFGYAHMAILTDDGELYTCDTGFDGYAGGLGSKYVPNGDKRLGRDAPDEASALAPRRVRVGGADGGAQGGADGGEGWKVSAVSLGRCHAAAATTTGEMFAFGCGALGGGDARGFPARVPDAPSDVYDVACGEYFTLASTADGGLFGWGDGNSGQLGTSGDGRKDNAAVEINLGARLGEKVRVVNPVAGYQHAMAIAVPGES